MIDSQFIELLACPACESGVSETSGTIICDSCGRKYPIVDGIPVMLLSNTPST